MEENPCEAVRVNVGGSRIVADKCLEYGVEMMVMVSTDKAVNPTNIMGCTKRLAEIYVQSLGLAMSFSFSIIPSKEYPGLISFRMDWLDLLAVPGTLKSLLQHHNSKSINSSAVSFLHSPTLTFIHDC